MLRRAAHWKSASPAMWRVLETAKMRMRISAMWGARVRSRRTHLRPSEEKKGGWSHRGAGEPSGTHIVAILLRNRTKQGFQMVCKEEG
jgi:hypothetical protein